MSTPNLADPAVFNNGYYPWAVKTPEASPFGWGTAPRNEFCVDASTSSRNEPGQPLISRALLKAVCEPFFDQMLTAVQEAVEQQLMQNQLQQMQQQSIDQLGDERCLRSSSLHFQQGACQLEPLPDEESTDLDEVGGAFASLLSGPSSEHQSEDEASDGLTHEMTLKSLPPSHGLDDEAGALDSEKSIMVCRHWKSK